MLSLVLISCNTTSESGLDAGELLSDAAQSVAEGDEIAVPTEKPETDDQPLAIASSNPDDEAVTAIRKADRSAQNSDTVGAASTDSTGNPETKERGFLASLFTSAPKKEPAAEQPPAKKDKPPKKPAETKPLVDLSEKNRKRPSFIQATVRGDDALPGVRDDFSLFEIVRKSGIDDDSDIDVYEAPQSIQLASAAGLARLAPNGLVRQHSGVDVKCLKPNLVRMLKKIERRFGRKVIVTSGYRNREHNRRVRGARNSFHMYCAAADIQVSGVSKWKLASYVRSLPGRGGVGTYCHTKSVHVDVGPERDWNWRCRRRKK